MPDRKVGCLANVELMGGRLEGCQEEGNVKNMSRVVVGRPAILLIFSVTARPQRVLFNLWQMPEVKCHEKIKLLAM